MFTWCYCFLGYVAILTPDPTTRDQLAYAHLIIRETMVDRAGMTTTEPFASREQRTAPSGGIPSSLGCRQQLFLDRDGDRDRPFVLCATELTTRGRNVPYFTYSHFQEG